MEIGISLGSNLGDRLQNLREARRRILAVPGVTPLGESEVYETEPVGVAPEYARMAFLNAALVIESRMPAEELAVRLHGIEAEMGRRRTTDRNSPRAIDIDVIYAADRRIATPGLTVPHPRWSERRFVVQPLADVRPELRLPGEGRTVGEVLRSLPLDDRVLQFASKW